MDRCAGAAAKLSGNDRKDLAIQALARSETVSDLAARHGVSRKSVYGQTHKAVAALDDAFFSATPDDEVLFELAMTKAWLRQVIVGLALICRSSYRGAVEFVRDLLGLPVSVGTVHHVLRSATLQAGVINREQDLRPGARVRAGPATSDVRCRCGGSLMRKPPAAALPDIDDEVFKQRLAPLARAILPTGHERTSPDNETDNPVSSDVGVPNIRHAGQTGYEKDEPSTSQMPAIATAPRPTRGPRRGVEFLLPEQVVIALRAFSA